MLQTPFSTGLSVAVWLFCTFFVANLLWTGTAAAVFRFLPWLLLSAWAGYVLLWRPRLVLHPASLDVVNLLRTHHVPFESLIAFRVTQVVSFDTTAGRITSWGAPRAGKLGPRTEAVAGHGRSGTVARAATLPLTQVCVERALVAWETRTRLEEPHPELPGADAGLPSRTPGAGPAVLIRWDRPAIAAGIVLVLWSAATLLPAG